MVKREENTHERLEQKLSELEQEWTAMKTGKSSSAASWITVEEALEFIENSPRRLMLSLQRDQACPEAEMIQIRSPCRRRLFHDSDDETETTISLSLSSCRSSNVMRVRDDDNKKKRERIVSVSMLLLLLLVLVALMYGFDHHSMNRQINTLVPT